MFAWLKDFQVDILYLRYIYILHSASFYVQ